MIVLNTAMANELTEFKKQVDAKIDAGMKKEKAIYEVLKQMIKDLQVRSVSTATAIRTSGRPRRSAAVWTARPRRR